MAQYQRSSSDGDAVRESSAPGDLVLAAPPCPPGLRAAWEVAVAALDPAALAADFLARVTRLPYYREHLMGAGNASRIEPYAVESMTAIVGCLSDAVDGAEAEARLTPVAAPLGTLRARSDVPAETLASAIRLDFSVIWDALVAQSDATEHVRLLVDRAARVWSVVETYAAITQEAYERERERRALEHDARTRRYLAALLGAQPVPDDDAVEAAIGLGFEPGGRFGVASVPQSHLDTARALLVTAHRYGVRSVTSPLQGRSLVLWQSAVTAEGAKPPGALALEEGLAALPCGLVRRVHGAAEIQPASATASYLVTLLRSGDQRAIDAERSWPRVARSQLAAQGFMLAEESRRALQVLPSGERTKLAATVRAYLSAGTVPETARRLHYHRNTALNHLHRFAEVTGLDATVPEDAALILVSGIVDADA